MMTFNDSSKELLMTERKHDMTGFGSPEASDVTKQGRRQLDDSKPRQSEEDMQREQFGPRGVRGQADACKMVPQRKKKTPSDFDPGHTA
jgi:hypothetical protein